MMTTPLVVVLTVINIGTYLSACSCPKAGACSVQCSKYVYLGGAHNTTRDRKMALESFNQCKMVCYQNANELTKCSDLEELENACKCDIGFYLDRTYNETCRPHTLCPPGEGVSIPGTFSRDTVCEPCDLGTFFSPTNSSEDRCMSCSYCNETEVVVAQCSTVSDTQCNTTGATYEEKESIDNLENDFDKRLDSEEKHITQIVISSNIGTSSGVGALLLFIIALVIVYMKRKQIHCFKRASSETLLQTDDPLDTNSRSATLNEAASCCNSHRDSQLRQLTVHDMYDPKLELISNNSDDDEMDIRHCPNQSDLRLCPNQSHCDTYISNPENSLKRGIPKFKFLSRSPCDESGVATILPRNAYALDSNIESSPGTHGKAAVYTFHRAMTDLSYHLCGIEWEMFFRRLIGEGTDEILGRVKRDHSRSVREQIYHMLLEWKKIMSKEATLDMIVKELEDFNENLLASLYRGKLPYIEYS